ncbi:hypothetical protein ANTRET_LOCUS6581 [Anthophora retusa]
MATIEEGFCHDDTDCSDLQYCYHVSKRCVDYTHCNRYNRQENDKRSRHPSQCGPCLAGYAAEKLGTGEMDYLCKKASIQENIPEKLNNYKIIYTTVGVLLFVCLMGAIVGIFYRKRTSKQEVDNPEQCGKLCTVEPTAPPMENSPFICCEKTFPTVPLNNNKILKDKNNLVRAAVSTPPSWVRANPNYENNLNNDNVNAMDQSHSIVELAESTDDQPNNWTSEQLTDQVSNRNLDTYEVERVDNSLNVALIQTNNPPLSNVTEEDNNSDNNNNSNNDSRQESSNTQSSGERVRAPNIWISQKISMNVNLLDSDLK